MKNLSKIINQINHFSIPLTKKYTAYSCISLPPCSYPTFAVLVIKVRNKQDNSEYGLYEVNRFSLSNDSAEILNSLLNEYIKYLNSKKFTDNEIEKHIQSITERQTRTHAKIIEDTKREFSQIFKTSNLANKSSEEIMKEIDQ